MSIFKCKMCGGALEIKNNETVATCEYCGTQQTLPKLDDDRRANLYDRANHFRRNNEFDKAMDIYEQILNEDNTDAEAYWSLVLCRYGIEYVEDPVSHKRIPTVNRAQFTSIFDDDNYRSALQYADGYQCSIYKEEAKAINEIQKGILAISQKEEPFDVFICYKETDSNGRRTHDSVLANDLYHQLTQEGFKVFFARITLEDKLGSAYEPYIFAALNSAKVMVVLGTKPEFFNAIWVKNEWSRYLALIKQGQKKMLIPAYKDMDPYDLPEEFSHLQAQDMSKLGFMQDLIRGIKKIAQADAPKTTVVKETVIAGGNANTAPLLKRAFMFLEDGDWNSANEYCEKVLDIDPENAEAYLGKLLAELGLKNKAALKTYAKSFKESSNYQKVIRFADDKLKAELSEISNQISANVETARKDAILSEGTNKMKKGMLSELEAAIKLFQAIPGWKDADEKRTECLKKIEEIKDREKEKQLEREKKKKKRKKLIGTLIPSVIALLFVVIFVVTSFDFSAIPLVTAKDLVAIETVYGGTVGLKKDGTVVSSGSCRIDTSEWEDIVAISAGAFDFGGLKNDGTVVVTGFNSLNVSEWKDIVAISLGDAHIVGLKKDGTVVAVGSNDYGQCDVSEWKDIIAISAGFGHTVGLKKDGTVVAVGNSAQGQCDVSEWKDIVAIFAACYRTMGVKKDGTVVVAGVNSLNVSEWKDIVAISLGATHIVGLKKDGTVVAVGSNDYGQCDVSEWEDIVAISVSDEHTVGLKEDGTMVACGLKDAGAHVWLGFFGKILL